MYRMYFRLLLGLIWMGVAVFGLVSGNVGMAGLFVVVGIAYLSSGVSMWKKTKEN